MAGIAQTYLMETGNERIPVVFEKVRGFPIEDGIALYLYENGTPAVLPDEFGGADGAIQSGAQPGTAIAALSGGGGVRLTASAWHEFPVIDVTEAFTLVSAGAIFEPLGATGGSYLTPIFGTKEINTGSNRGFIIELRDESGSPDAGTQISSEMKPIVSGAFAGTVPPVVFPTAVADWVIEGWAVRVLRHDGAGNFKFEVYTPNGGFIPVLRATGVWDTTTMTTVAAVQDKTLTPFIGGLDTTAYGKGVMEIDVSIAYDTALSQVKVNTIVTAAIALAEERLRI